MQPLRPLLLLSALLLAAPGPVWGLDAQVMYQKVRGAMLIIYMKTGTSYGDDRDWGFQGTGFAMGDGTLAVTNQHVANGKGALLRAKALDAKSMIDVEVLRVSTDNDLAVLRLAQALPPLELAGDEVNVGQEVAALGNPAGFMGTLSTGVVSGIRSYPQWKVKDVIQTTVAVSPGSSGSPLLDAKGRVVGVIRGGYFDAQNLNFAVPVAKLRKLLGRDLLPGAETGRDMPPESAGGLDVRKAADGSITIIQERPKK